MRLADLFADLDRHTGPIPIDALSRKIKDLALSFDDVAEFAKFGADRYQRNLVHAGPSYYALVLCWRAGQRSPIHDHRGSACGVKIIKGVATETRFEQVEGGHVFATGSRHLPEGSVCASFDHDIHQMSNLQPPDHDLVTLHIYSPPLLVMGTYSLTENRIGEFADPVFEFCHGAGI